MRAAYSLPLSIALLFAAPHAFADDDALPPLPTTTVVAQPASPGLTVVVPVQGGGSVTATGCDSVRVSGASTEVGTAAACPAAPPAREVPPRPEVTKPKYAPDGLRKGLIIAAPLVYGMGSAVAGISYIMAHARCSLVDNVSYGSGSGASSSSCGTGALVSYGVITTVVPSIPRLAVGDVPMALLYGGLRGLSVASAAFIDWGKRDDTNWQGPFVLGFALPVTLAVLDLATTPHAEDMHPKEAASSGAAITSIAPTTVSDRTGTHGGAISLTGVF